MSPKELRKLILAAKKLPTMSEADVGRIMRELNVRMGAFEIVTEIDECPPKPSNPTKSS